MGLLLAVILLALLLGGLGFAVHVLWVFAVVLLVVWVAGWFVRPGGGRWYHW